MVSGKEEETFFGSRSSLETIELAQGLVQSGMDLDVLLFSISQFLCNEKKRKASEKLQNQIVIQHDLLNRGLIWMYGSWRYIIGSSDQV